MRKAPDGESGIKKDFAENLPADWIATAGKWSTDVVVQDTTTYVANFPLCTKGGQVPLPRRGGKRMSCTRVHRSFAAASSSRCAGVVGSRAAPPMLSTRRAVVPPPP